MDLIVIIDGVEIFDNCVLRAKECNSANPCPLHAQIDSVKKNLKAILSETSIGDLLEGDKAEFIRSIATASDLDLVKKLAAVPAEF
jgi:Rrf2 family transcriptional regulator, iron-sulfur cluster assembly transcription factor